MGEVRSGQVRSAGSLYLQSEAGSLCSLMGEVRSGQVSWVSVPAVRGRVSVQSDGRGQRGQVRSAGSLYLQSEAGSLCSLMGEVRSGQVSWVSVPAVRGRVSVQSDG